MTAALTMQPVRDGAGNLRHVPTPFVSRPAAGGKARKARVAPDPIKTNGETAAEELRLLIERAERIVEEIKGLQDDLKDTFAEASSRGYDAKAMKEIMAIRMKDRAAHAEHQAVMETYLACLGML